MIFLEFILNEFEYVLDVSEFIVNVFSDFEYILNFYGFYNFSGIYFE